MGEIILNKEDLLHPLQLVSSVVDRRALQPILSNFLLEVQDGKMFLTGSNTQVEIRVEANTQPLSDENFLLALPARKLLDICRTFPDKAKLNLTIEEKKVLLKSGRSKFLLALTDVKQYPLAQKVECDTPIFLKEDALKRTINSCLFAVAQNDARVYLNGMFFEINRDKIRAVATNGHILSVADLNNKNDIKESEQNKFIIPKKAIVELERLLRDSDDSKVELHIASNYASFYFNNINLITRLVDGQFPEYQKVIPKKTNNILKIDRESLYKTLCRVSVLSSNDKFKEVRFILSKDMLRVVSRNNEQEEAEEDIVGSYQGSEIEIGFNATYLLDMLSTIDKETVEFFFQSSENSVLVIPENTDRSLYVIMPVKM